MDKAETKSMTVWGIYLGTTYSCISKVDEYGRPVVVGNRDGDPVTPWWPTRPSGARPVRPRAQGALRGR